MLRGRFGNTSGRPFLEGHVHLVHIGIELNISFLVDTGADRTLVTPIEGMRMGIDYTRLTPGGRFEGLGGSVEGYEELAIISFLESGRTIHSYTMKIGITPPRTKNHPHHPEDISALLGRDILDQWRMTYNPSRNSLSFKVLSSDFTRGIGR